MWDVIIGGIHSIQWYLGNVWKSRHCVITVLIGRLSKDANGKLYWAVSHDSEAD